MNRPQDGLFWERLPQFDPDTLAPPARAWNADRWVQAAQMEHASIASFARFALQLIAVGAPPLLLAGAHQAAIDEVHHTRMSFALASRLLGRAVGPGPLPLPSDVLGAADLVSVAAETAADGCVGESIAAAEARAAADEAREPAVAAALTAIGRDEEAHAALAWSFVGWAVRTGGPAVAAAVRHSVQARCERSLEALAPAPDEHPGYGHLAARRAHDVRAATIDEVIRPALASLLAGAAPAGGPG